MGAGCGGNDVHPDDPPVNVLRRQRGVSLVELMIALAIGTVLVLGLVQVFSASRAAYQMSEGMSRVQENARFAMDFLQRDVRMAGHFGCVNDQAHFVQDAGEPRDLTPAVASLDFNVSIQGFEAADTAPGDTLEVGALTEWSAPPIALNPAPVAGSDILVLRYLSPLSSPVTEIGTVSATTLSVLQDHAANLTHDGVSNPTIFGIADCSQADVFAGTFGTHPDGTPTGVISADQVVVDSLSARYNPFPAGQTRLYRANSIVYYVGISPTTGEPGLRRARADGTGAYSVNEELVEGVENVQFLYGRDETPIISSRTPPVGNITSLDTAATIGASAAEWRRVGLIQMGMLVRSPDRAVAPEAASDAANPRVLGVEFEPADANDARYRSTYEVTIALRNRLFGN